MSRTKIYDIAVIGGGINGTGVAADAAGRGLNVFLCEQNDLASGTSSASSKLIHGGLRYLEHYEFRLVKEALAEREVLLNKAPHLVSPLKFTMPHRKHLRPAWMIRCGLFLYDHLSRRNTLPKAKKIRFGENSILKEGITKGFDYYDCWVDDARLVVTNALAARERGANVRTQTICEQIRYDQSRKIWVVSLLDKLNDARYEIEAKNIVNASGPWLNQFLETSASEIKPKRQIRLIKGSHIIVPQVHDKNEAFILQNEDKRVVFVLPYLNDYSIIGTTDKEYQGNPEDVAIDDWEVNYLIDVFNLHFKQQIKAEDIVSTYSGIRPLCDDESSDPSAITRDYTLELHEQSQSNALISVYGGKITTYRKLAEAVLTKLAPYIAPKTEAWTSSEPLPGALKYGQTRDEIKQGIEEYCPWLETELLNRFTATYGLNCFHFLGDKKEMADMGQDFGHSLYQAEVDYLIEREWATTADDILWRRTKLGLKLSKDATEALQRYVEEKQQPLSSYYGEFDHPLNALVS